MAYSPIVYDHLAAIAAMYDSLIRQKTVEQLTYEPDVKNPKSETRSAASCLQRGMGVAVWPEQSLPGLCQIDYGSRKVLIVAIGVKDRNRLYVGGQEVTL